MSYTILEHARLGGSQEPDIDEPSVELLRNHFKTLGTKYTALFASSVLRKEGDKIIHGPKDGAKKLIELMQTLGASKLPYSATKSTALNFLAALRKAQVRGEETLALGKTMDELGITMEWAESVGPREQVAIGSSRDEVDISAVCPAGTEFEIIPLPMVVREEGKTWVKTGKIDTTGKWKLPKAGCSTIAVTMSALYGTLCADSRKEMESILVDEVEEKYSITGTTMTKTIRRWTLLSFKNYCYAAWCEGIRGADVSSTVGGYLAKFRFYLAKNATDKPTKLGNTPRYPTKTLVSQGMTNVIMAMYPAVTVRGEVRAHIRNLQNAARATQIGRAFDSVNVADVRTKDQGFEVMAKVKALKAVSMALSGAHASNVLNAAKDPNVDTPSFLSVCIASF